MSWWAPRLIGEFRRTEDLRSRDRDDRRRRDSRGGRVGERSNAIEKSPGRVAGTFCLRMPIECRSDLLQIGRRADVFWEGTEMSSMDDLWNSIVSDHPNESGEFLLQQFTE